MRSVSIRLRCSFARNGQIEDEFVEVERLDRLDRRAIGPAGNGKSLSPSFMCWTTATKGLLVGVGCERHAFLGSGGDERFAVVPTGSYTFEIRLGTSKAERVCGAPSDAPHECPLEVENLLRRVIHRHRNSQNGV